MKIKLSVSKPLQYIPEKEFDKIVMKVRERKAEHSWQKFCTVSSGVKDEDDENEESIRSPTPMESIEFKKFPSILAPSRTRIYDSKYEILLN